MLAWFSLRPHPGELAGFLLGWLAGWLAYWRNRPLPILGKFAPPTGGREMSSESVAVVVPARNEEGAIGSVIGGLAWSAADEVVVVDDHSTDATARLAAAAGARVVPAPDLPDGWLGKPNACAAGVAATTAPVLVFLDADISPPTDLLQRLAAEVERHPDSLVSVQPWHRPGSAAEQLSLPFNIVALMGSGGVAAIRTGSPLAFGPVLACRRDRYVEIGGHSRPEVRAAVAEDLALGRAFGEVRLFTGRPDVSFRMFPGGVRTVIDGWTKHIAVGAGRTSWWLLAATVAWVWSQTIGWAISPWCHVAALVQLFVLARRAGRFSPWAVLVGPLLMLVFTYVVLRSGWRVVRRRPIGWKDRMVQIR